MSYIATLVSLVVAAILVGYWCGRCRRGGRVVRRWVAPLIAVVGLVAWFAAAWVTRRYSDTMGVGWPLAEWFAHRGKWYVFAAGVLWGLGLAAAQEAVPDSVRRRVVYSFGVLLVVCCVVWKTVPVYARLGGRVHRGQAGFLIQSVPFTCAPVSLGNLLEQGYGHGGMTERELSRLCGTTIEGSTMHDLARAARRLGLRARCVDLDLEEVRAWGRPVVVTISTLPSVHHAVVLVEVDGDVIHYIDPTEGYEYRRMPAAEFVKDWYGRTLVVEEAGPS